METRWLLAVILGVFCFLAADTAVGQDNPLDGMTASQSDMAVCTDSKTGERTMCILFKEKEGEPPNIRYLALFSDEMDLLSVYRVNMITNVYTKVWSATPTRE